MAQENPKKLVKIYGECRNPECKQMIENCGCCPACGVRFTADGGFIRGRSKKGKSNADKDHKEKSHNSDEKKNSQSHNEKPQKSHNPPVSKRGPEHAGSILSRIWKSDFGI